MQLKLLWQYIFLEAQYGEPSSLSGYLEHHMISIILTMDFL